VRELQNAVERAVILCAGKEISEADIQLSGLSTDGARRPGQAKERGYRAVSLEVMEQEHILATLDRTHWNKSQAAQILGIERSTLDRKLKRYDVGPESRVKSQEPDE
jgi:Nif-specific regulatory protein